MKRILSIAVVVTLASSFAFAPASANAAANGLAFGGLNEITIPCTCASSVWWHFFTPLYLNTSVPMAGALTSQSGSSIIYMSYFIHPGNWSLGTYMPGVQLCYMYAVYTCFLLPSYGHIVPPTGTSP